MEATLLLHEACMSLVRSQVLRVRQLRARPFKYGLKSLAANKRRIALRLLQEEVNSSTSGVLVSVPAHSLNLCNSSSFTVKIEFYMQRLLPVS